MKKTVKIMSCIGIVAIISCLCVTFVFGASSVAYAEEEVVREREETNTLEEVFRSEIVKNAITFIVSIIGSLTGLMCIIGKIRSVGADMKTTIKRCSDGDESVAKTIKELMEAKKSLEETAEELQEQIKAMKNQMTSLCETAEKSEILRKDDTDKIRRMLQLGFCSDASLVKNGLATKIFEVNNETKE